MVFTKLGKINNEEDFKKASKATAFSLIAAPTMTIVSSLCCYFLYQLGLFLLQNTILVPLSLYILIFSLIYTFRLSTKESNKYLVTLWLIKRK